MNYYYMQVNTHENNIVHKIIICTVWQKDYYKNVNAPENDIVMYILQPLLLLIKLILYLSEVTP